jgi:hypothetical protein
MCIELEPVPKPGPSPILAEPLDDRFSGAGSGGGAGEGSDADSDVGIKFRFILMPGYQSLRGMIMLPLRV